jgi:hypothetical protein
MKKSIVAIFLYALFTLLAPELSSGGICIGLCIGGGGDIPNGFIYSESENTVTMRTATTADAFEAPYFPFEKRENPKRLLFLDRDGGLLGGATQIDQKGLVFVTARHVLAGQKELIIKTEHSQEYRINDFFLFQAKAKAKAPLLDVLFLILKKQISYAPTGEDLISLIASTSRLPNQNSKWFSWQYGIFDERITDGVSSGLLVEKNPTDLSPYFWLDSGESNYTSPGSSGSVVWQPLTSKSHSLLPIGVIQCMEHPAASERSKSSHLPKPRFLSLFYLVSEPLIWETIDAEALLQGPIHPTEANCTPIDGRQGGGF